MARGPVGRGSGRRGAEVLEFARRLDAGSILVSLLVAGFALRVFIAGVYLPLSGFSIDIGDFTAWGQRLASLGPAEFYAEDYFSDYPPGYLYVLWLLGAVGAGLAPIVGQDATAGLVKIPGIAADVGVAWLLFVIARRWAGQLISGPGITPDRLGIAAAAVYLFNPATIFDSAVWGQIDSVGTLVVLATLYALGRGWTELASAGAVLAMLVKFQFAIVIPIVVVVGLKRHLFGRSSDAAHAGRREPARVLTSLVAGVGVLVILMLPFGMTLYVPLPGGDPTGLLGFLPEADPTRSLVGKLVEAASTYTGLSINAFNLWRNPWSGLGDTLHWGDDTGVAATIGSAVLTWQHVGTILFAVAAVLALWQVARRDDMRGLLLATLVLAIAFFVLPTRVHERYLFPALALATPLLLAWRGWPFVYAGLSLSFFANIYWVYTEDWSFAGSVINPGANGAPMPQDPLLTATLLTDWGIWALSALAVAMLGVVGWRSIRLALSRPSLERAEPLPLPQRERPARTAPLPADWEAAPDEGERGASAPAPLSWLRRNPADAYLREPGRRLGRRDALILLGLVVFALVFRLWRLDVPRGHHFDEVYHARSATEWLSNWHNGWDRDVYEWTHPMLAKYLIAAGIAVADPNGVEGTTVTDAPATALAVAPARASRGFERSVAFSSSGGASIVARDASSGEELTGWSAGGPIASMAYEPDGERLFVGLADRGTIETYELAGYLTAPDAAAPPAGPTIDVDLEAVTQMVVPRDAPVVLIRGPDGVAAVDRQTDEVTARADGSYSGVAHVAGGDDEGTLVAATDPARGAVLLLDGETLQVRLDDEGDEVGVITAEAPLAGPLVARGSGDDRQVFALTGPVPATDEHPQTAGGVAAVDADQGTLADLVPLPGAGSLIGYQPVANLLYVAGTDTSGEPVTWTLDPHLDVRDDSSAGLATFDETALPGPALAMAFDVADTAQVDDHGRLLLSTAAPDGGGAVVRLDAGSNAFAWRLAGVVFGAILVGLVYLLAATLFGRQRIAVLAGAFVAIDGMSYVMSRIAMNDIFVAVFIVAAYLLFWQIWSGRWARSAWWVLPAVGVLIGLAAATKWVGFYALAGIWVLALARSSLGRVLLIALVAVAAVVGGIGAPWPFGVAMLLALGIGLAYVHARPIGLDLAEARAALPATGVVLGGIGLALALAVGQIDGRQPGSGVEYLFALLARGAEAGWPAWLMLAVAALLIAWRAVRSLREPRSDARWWSPVEMGGFAWSWMGACLVIVPLTVYALSYVPYLQLGHTWAIPATGPGYGWSLEELHSQMFGYHFNLQEGHASSSPWWSWPLALKPTWFFNGTYDADRIAVIYNGGNPLLFWAGVPAVVAAGVLAWRRRSPALVLLVAAFAFQLVPWTRIERATFAYHYLTAVIFAMIAVAYVVDELLRRPAWRELAIGYLALVAAVGLLVFPLGSALPMPDWYINAARALPPWNFGFQFPDPPTGERGDLFSVSGLKVVLGLLVAAAAVAWSLYGRVWAPSLLELIRARRRVAQ